MAACRAPSPYDRYDEVEWRLVEKAIGLDAGDARLAEARVLVFERDTAPPVIRCRLLQESAVVGEAAEMEIWSEGGEAEVRLTPSRPGVRVLGPEVIRVGREAVRVRFTADSAGRGTLRAEETQTNTGETRRER
jgi:hypothetical protein